MADRIIRAVQRDRWREVAPESHAAVAHGAAGFARKAMANRHIVERSASTGSSDAARADG